MKMMVFRKGTTRTDTGSGEKGFRNRNSSGAESVESAFGFGCFAVPLECDW